MTFRAGGIAVAFVSLAGIPAVIGLVTQTPAPAAPKEAALTVPLSGDEKIGDSTARLNVLATGEAPETGTLLSADGTDAVAVSSLPTGFCKGLPGLQAVGAEPDGNWCLGLEGIRDGSQVSGKLSGAKTLLTLTVTRRSSFYWRSPMWIVVGGLLIGLLAVVVPVGLRRSIRRGLLDQALAVNEERAGGRIEDLREWVDDERSKGKKDDDLLPIVRRLMQEGPRVAERSKEELRKRALESPLPQDCDYRDGIDEFLAEHEVLKAADLVSVSQGTGAYPAAEWITGLDKLERQWHELVGYEEKAGPDDAMPKAVKEALIGAWEGLESAKLPSDVDGVDERLRAVREKLPRPSAPTSLLAAPITLNMIDAGTLSTGVQLGQISLARGPAPESYAVAEPPPSRAGRLWLYTLATGLLVSFAVVFAVVSIEHSVFEPDAAFGGFQDDFALLSAAIAAGVSSTVVGLLAPWDGREPSES